MNAKKYHMKLDKNIFSDAIYGSKLQFCSYGKESLVFSLDDMFVFKTFVMNDRNGINYSKELRILRSISISLKMKSVPHILLDMESPFCISDVTDVMGRDIYNSSGYDIVYKSDIVELINIIRGLKVFGKCYISRYILLMLKYDEEITTVCKSNISLDDIIDIYYQLLIRMFEMKRLGIIHRDIKDTNIMVSRFNIENFHERLEMASNKLVEIFSLETSPILIYNRFYSDNYFKSKYYAIFIDFGYACIYSNSMDQEKLYLERFNCRYHNVANYHTDLYATSIVVYQLLLKINLSDSITIPNEAKIIESVLSKIYTPLNYTDMNSNDDASQRFINSRLLNKLADIIYASIRPSNNYTIENCLNHVVFENCIDKYSLEILDINNIMSSGFLQYVNITPHMNREMFQIFKEHFSNRISFPTILRYLIFLTGSYHKYNMTNFDSFGNIPYYIKILSMYYICSTIYTGDVVTFDIFIKDFFQSITSKDDDGTILKNKFLSQFNTINNFSDWFNFIFSELIYFDVSIVTSAEVPYDKFEDIISFLYYAEEQKKGFIDI